MKSKSYLSILLSLSLLLTALTLSGCNASLEKKMREQAAAYLETLAAKTGIPDTFAISEKKLDFSGKADPVAVTVHSTTFADDFSVYVPREGGALTDTYYALSFKEAAQQQMEALFREALTKDPPSDNIQGLRLRFKDAVSANLSGRRFNSLAEFCQAAGQPAPLEIDVQEQAPGKDQLTENQLNLVLTRMQQEGVYATFYPYASGTVWFEVLQEGVWKTVQSGADSGAMLQRTEYLPTVIPEKAP